jgi:cytochrome c oxidase subunit 7c
MLARAAFRAASAPTIVARRGFQSTRAQLGSPYHYPEGPRSNLPFDPLKRGFAFKYWGFMGELCRAAIAGQELTATATGFGLPFGLAGKTPYSILRFLEHALTRVEPQSGRRRRTSRKRSRTQHGHGHGYGALEAHRTCRIYGGPRMTILDTPASISLSVFNAVSPGHHTLIYRDAEACCFASTEHTCHRV